MIASFSIWLEEKENKEKILNEFKEYRDSLPKYEVELILKKYQFEEVKEFKTKKEELLSKALRQLEVLKDEKQLNNLKGYEIEELFDFFPSKNNYDLEKYILDLESFIKEIQFLEVDESIERAKFYKATIQITNSGLKSDENIYCEIELGKENFAFEDIEDFKDELKKIIEEKIPTLPDFPKPIRVFRTNNAYKIDNFDILKNSLHNTIRPIIMTQQSRVSIPKLHNLHPPYFFVDDHRIKITKLNLNVGLVHTKDFYLILNKENYVKYYITSKNLPKPLKGAVKVIYED